MLIPIFVVALILAIVLPIASTKNDFFRDNLPKLFPSCSCNSISITRKHRNYLRKRRNNRRYQQTECRSNRDNAFWLPLWVCSRKRWYRGLISLLMLRLSAPYSWNSTICQEKRYQYYLTLPLVQTQEKKSLSTPSSKKFQQLYILVHNQMVPSIPLWNSCIQMAHLTPTP